MEIERKYLVSVLPFDVSDYPVKTISQAYISRDPVIRIRKNADKGKESYILTCKGPGLIEREELNLALSEESYRHLLSKTEGRIIEKNRYLIPLEDGLLCELDIFKGDLSPLIYAEVEFSSREAADAFTPPDWFGKEVSEDPRYQNVSLAFSDEILNQF